MKNQNRSINVSDFLEWRRMASQIGWVHCHDEYIVVDCVESGVCVGEFSDKSGGWLDASYIEHHSAR